MKVVIAGGGVAGLEALLGLRALAPAELELTLVAPSPEFSYRPLAVAEPFALGHAQHVPLARVVADAHATYLQAAVESVDDAAGTLQLSGGLDPLPFDALLVATGGRVVAGIDGATTWWPEGDPEVYGGLLRDLEEGYLKRLAIAVPPGASWPLPAYELAAMTAGEARSMGYDDVAITIVTPEPKPLALFGNAAGEAVAEELQRAGVTLRTGVVARRDGNALVLDPGGERLDVQRVLAVPRIVGPALPGLAADDEGFVRTGLDQRVVDTTRTWAAGDGIVSPLKFGGLATHQARVAIAQIARLAGATDVPEPGQPVLQGRLLVGRSSRRLRGRGDGESAPLWWPQGKVAGEYLPRWLAEHGIVAPVSSAEPSGGVAIHRTLHDLEQAARPLFDAGRRYRISDPQLASLGRRMTEFRSR